MPYYEINSLYKINETALIINITLFIMPWFGLLAMFPLGILQLLSALSITLIYYKTISHKSRILLNLYWLFVAINLIFIIAVHYNNKAFLNSGLSIVSLFVLQGVTAFYFVYATAQIKKHLSK